jgi:CRP-like cAMP-binding protein
MGNNKIFDPINKYVAKRISISKKEEAYFNSLLKYKKVKKKDFLLRAGEVCDFEIFIIKGCVRVYYIDANGIEVDLYFAIEDWWVGDLASFYQQKPSQLYIQTIEESELLIISYKNKEKLFEKVPAFERLFRLMLQRANETLINRLISNLSKPAEERYKEFTQKYPTISQRVPQQLIAAYLGISPEFLSKLRKRIVKGK